jgi:UMF1 family MFS transporter
MSATKVGIIGILVQLTAVFSSVATPKWQRRMKWTNQQLLLRVAVAGGVLPMYACLGLVLPFGGLRSEGEMYVAAAWFGMVRFYTLWRSVV